jgi:ABC-2 type transport system ATP-binding protein
VGGDTDGLERVVAGVPGVTQVQAAANGGLEFESAPGVDARPEVARALVGAGFDLLELRPMGLSLEEIFLELTREEPVPPEFVEEVAEEPEGPEEGEEDA